MLKKVLITGGTGLIGTRLTQLLLERNYEVVLLSRSKSDIPNVSVFQYDIKKKYIQSGAFEGVTHLIHLAGAGVADKRWTDDRKKEIITSRTETIALIFDYLKVHHHPLKSFVSASGSSYYGENTGDTKQTEKAPAGSDFLSKVTIQWEEAADKIASLGIRTVKLRTGVVISAKGGAIPKIAQPIHFGLGAPLGNGQQWMSWIHIDDICSMYIHALENENWHGAYNAVAATPITNEDLTLLISKILNKPQFLPSVPSFMLRLAFGEMANVVLGSSYIVNERIKSETNFEYLFPEITAALKDTLS